MRNWQRVLFPFLASALGGCYVATEEEGGATDAVEEVMEPMAFTIFALGSTNSPDIDMGPATTQTCVLTGVAGDLNDGGYCRTRGRRARW